MNLHKSIFKKFILYINKWSNINFFADKLCPPRFCSEKTVIFIFFHMVRSVRAKFSCISSLNFIFKDIFFVVITCCSSSIFDFLFASRELRGNTMIMLISVGKIPLRFELYLLFCISCISCDSAFYLLRFCKITKKMFLIQRWGHISHPVTYAMILFFSVVHSFFLVRCDKAIQGFFLLLRDDVLEWWSYFFQSP